MSDEFVQIIGDRADVLGDAPLIVVQDADKLLRRLRNIVERLEGNAIGQSGIAENGDNILIGSALVAGGADAQRG